MKPQITLTMDEFQLINEFITENFGISFPEHKLSVIESRLKPRVEELNMNSFLDYYLFLQYNANGERSHIARLVTNNESYFFRETYQFDAMFEHALDGLKADSVTPSTLRFLCAGCSSGEEPYTLNIFLRENQFRMWGYDISVDAFDIDEDSIAIAKKAEYGQNSMRIMEEEKIQKYFAVTESGKFLLKPLYRERVNFNLGNITIVEDFKRPLPYDVIFCRNVLIYFSEQALRKAIENFARVLKPNGLLFLGHSESIIGLSKHFETVRLGNCIVYKRIVC